MATIIPEPRAPDHGVIAASPERNYTVNPDIYYG